MKKFGEAGTFLSSNVVNSRGNTQAVEETESTIKSSIEIYTGTSNLLEEEQEETRSENASKIATLINKAASTESGKASIIASLQKESDMSAGDYNDKLAEAIGSFFDESSIVSSIKDVLENADEVSEMIAEMLEVLEAPEEVTDLLEEVRVVLVTIIDHTEEGLGLAVAEVLGLAADEESTENASYGNVATLMIIQGVASTVDEINFSELSTVSDFVEIVNPILPALGAIDVASGTQFKEFLGLVMEILSKEIS